MKTAGVLHADPPTLDAGHAADAARSLFGVDSVSMQPLVSERDQNFLLDEADGSRWVLKVSNAAEDPGVVQMEVEAVEHVARIDPELPVPRPRPTLEGDLVGNLVDESATHLVRLLPFLPGRTAAPGKLDGTAIRGIGQIAARTGVALRGFFHASAGRAIEWDQKHLPDLVRHADLVEDADRRRQLDRVVERFMERALPALPALRAQVIHNDITLDNLLLDDAGAVSGIIDFGDMTHTALVLDVPATLQSLVRDREDLFAVAGDFLPGYTEVLPLERREAELLADLLAGRMAQTILISAWRTRQFPDNAYISGWAEPAWALLDQLERVGMDRAAERLAGMVQAPAMRGRSAAPPTDEALRERRERVLGSALESLSYARPLHLVRGSGAWMFDAEGNAFLDAYNNVPVVGHAHPRVTEAIARQAALLNTNTRYLHATIVELAERIIASMPAGLDTVMFVNSGSEANDLAWRLATIATGADAGLVTEWAYHGVTSAIVEFSPSEWPRGERPDGVETFPAPDTYRGAYAGGGDVPALARQDLEAAVERLAERGRRPAALFVDSLFTSAGIFTPDPAVVAATLQAARDAGALLVADEVQSGHGRSGDGLWRFPAWGVTPDVVTLGKPMGNGHPIAAVVTRSELADCMAQARTAFFSTFGGNPVACVAALTVLDVLEDERLVENAADVGDRLRAALADLAARHPVIGDVRGRGLMVGVELVEPGPSRPPAVDLAGAARDWLRERGVLVGTTRREQNVLKIRPPLCITRDEAAMIVSTLDDVLTALEADAT
ncbi:MAG TPA: aminotransferase class III-fold pyridoxal phosphate-dependent enzyme [Candidatus Limnocylindria bacterium]|jgi:4-aminobutyrate aminotransferase-like enzyme/Ser/Thr protein kinase RdoA (MazF antagonist)